MATIKKSIAGKDPQPSPAKEQHAAIRRLLRGRGSVSIGALALGESTPVVVNGMDFRAEWIRNKAGATLLDGYFYDGDRSVITFGVNIRDVSEESLERLLNSVRTACKDN